MKFRYVMVTEEYDLYGTNDPEAIAKLPDHVWYDMETGKFIPCEGDDEPYPEDVREVPAEWVEN